MLLTWILSAVGGFMITVISGLPHVDFPTQSFAGFTQWIGRTVRLVDAYFPVRLLGLCLACVLAARLMLMVWSFALFLWHQVWGSS